MTDNSTSPPGPDQAVRRYNANDIIAGKYKLISVLGEGGMGEVWEAKNIGLDSPVAIKLIRGDLDEASAAERLVQEARAAARLGHPAIVRVFDVGETRFSDPFIVMERLHGDNLGDLLGAEGRLPAVAAVQILLPIADALATAHTKGIVHRDIKPENIYLAEDENGELQPKLVDFGVAKLENAELDTKLTMRGTIVGSPGYLSPEQARGSDSADYRVDVWAFSVVLYELITGMPPFNGGNYNALLRSIVEDEPKPTSEQAAGDSELWNIIERGLRKNVAERWPSMLEYGRALAHWAFSQGVDEDICGTGLEAKWLVNKPGGRGHLASGNFEDAESPSAIRQGRRNRTGSPMVNPESAAATLAPPPHSLQLPSPSKELAGLRDSYDAHAYSDTELRGMPARRKSRRVWLLLVGGTALLVLAISLLTLGSAETDGARNPSASGASQPEPKADAKHRTDSPAKSQPVLEVPAPRRADAGTAAEPRGTGASGAADARPSKAGAKPGPERVPPATVKARTSVQRQSPKKGTEKPLTPKPQAPKLDLKKPY